MADGAKFCSQCGGQVAGTAGAAPAAGTGHFSSADALAAASIAAPVLGRGGGDLAGYMMSRAALQNLEASGQGDSPMADMARAGLVVSKVKIAVGIVGFVVALIFFLVIWSQIQHQQQQFNISPNPGSYPSAAPLSGHIRETRVSVRLVAPPGGRYVGPARSASAHRASRTERPH